ncbi:MAG: ABC transporter ATP-binding protein [Archaeoglobaceae archaeon]
MRLKVLDVEVELRSRKVLKGVSLEVEEGELAAVLGPNGAGKSTLLRTVFGILKPKRGVVLFDGRRIELEDVARVAAYLPQETPETKLRVIDVVLLGRTPHMTGIRRASREDYEIALRSLEEVGLAGYEDRTFDELSGGEKQKVLLARLFAQQPKVMLLDEPTAHLDLAAQIEIMRIVRKRVDEGCSALISVHDVNLAATFADKVIMLKDGVVRYAGGIDVISEESVRDVYGINAIVRRVGRHVFVIPTSGDADNGIHVHVICGGGSGAAVIQMLRERGYRVSVGVVNVLDTDFEVASQLGCEIVSEAPFSEVSEESHRKNLEIIEKCDFVILANLSVGRGNLKNLIAAKRAAELGKLIVVEREPFAARNFAGEEAAKIYAELRRLARVVRCDAEAVQLLA